MNKVPLNQRNAVYAESAGSGFGVHRQRVNPGPAPAEDHEEEVIPLDGPVEWSDTPTFPNQMVRGPDFWKLDRIEVLVLDLSKNEDVQRYSELLTLSNSPGSNRFITSQDRQFSQDTHNWKVFLEIQIVKYRKLLKTKRNEQAS